MVVGESPTPPLSLAPCSLLPLCAEAGDNVIAQFHTTLQCGHSQTQRLRLLLLLGQPRGEAGQLGVMGLGQSLQGVAVLRIHLGGG